MRLDAGLATRSLRLTNDARRTPLRRMNASRTGLVLRQDLGGQGERGQDRHRRQP
jgi:hypothetical protein